MMEEKRTVVPEVLSVEHKKKSISRSLTVTLIMVVLSVVLVFQGYIYLYQYHKATLDLEKKADEYITGITEIIAYPMWTFDQVGIVKIGFVFLQNELIDSFRIVDPQGAIIYEKTEREHMKEKLIYRSKSIEYNGKVLGWAELTMSVSKVTKELQLFLYMGFVTLLVSIIVLTISTGILLKKFLQKPMSVLLEGMDTVATGDYSHAFEKIHEKELAEIADRFREMALQVRERENAFQEANARLEALFQGARDAIFIADAHSGIILNLNIQAEILVGRPRSELVGKHYSVLYPPDKSDLYGRVFSKDDDTEVHALEEAEVATGDGSSIPVEISSSLIQLVDGRQVIQGIFRDITERKRAEENLEKAQAFLAEAIAQSPSGILIADVPDVKIRMANPAALGIRGDTAMPLTEIDVGKHSMNWQTYYPDGITPYPSEKLPLSRAILEGVVSENVEAIIRREGGENRWVSVNAGPVRDKEGRIIAGIVVFHDITERKQAEESLKKAEEKYRSIFENAVEGIFQSTLQGKYVSVNPAMAKTFGFHSPEEMVQQTTDIASQFYVDPGQRKQFLSIIDKEGSIQKLQYQACRKDGEKIWISANVKAVRDKDGNTLYYEGSLEDITELKHMEEEKERLQAQLLQSQKMEAIGTLAGGIAHDFNNLLMGIQGYASLMLLRSDENDTFHEKLKKIEQLVQSGADLTKQLLGFARGGKYEVKTTNLNELINKSSDVFGRTKKEITIHKKYAMNLYSVEVDRGQIEQVLFNLFVNAWQAMPGGGKLFLETDNVTIDENSAAHYDIKPGRYVRVSVTDIGTGMDKETQQRVFEPFFTTKEPGAGSGLGLASAYGIIRNHGGFITVYSEKGNGTTFTFSIPASEKEIVLEKESSSAPARGAGTILLVDDQEVILDVGKSLLEALGYTVLTARSGQEGIDLYAKNDKAIDLVVLDMIMPGMGGGETYRRLKELSAGIKVLLSSGYSLNDEAQKILDQGCRGFIQKPFQLSDLSEKIRETLDI